MKFTPRKFELSAPQIIPAVRFFFGGGIIFRFRNLKIFRLESGNLGGQKCKIFAPKVCQKAGAGNLIPARAHVNQLTGAGGIRLVCPAHVVGGTDPMGQTGATEVFSAFIETNALPARSFCG